MSPRIVIVPSDSQLLQDSRTQVLHTYANGESLIRTEAPSNESTETTEVPINPGLQLPGVSAETIRSAQQQFDRQIQPESLSAIEPIITAYIELIGIVDPVWLDRLQAFGIELLQYQPQYTYLGRGTASAFRAASQQPFVLRITPLEDGLKPNLPIPESGAEAVWIVIQGSPEVAPRLITELNQLTGVEIDPQQEIDRAQFYLRIRARITAEGQTQLLNHPGVLAIEPFQAPQPEDETAGLIIAGQYTALGQPQGSYLRWLEDQGLNGEGVTIGIVDAGIDLSHSSYGDRIRDLNDGRKSWHGTFVAGHAAGSDLTEKDDRQFFYGLGMAPAANLLSQDNQRTPSTLCRETVMTTAPSGIAGTVQNNSWGTGTREVMDYGSQEAAYDRLVRNSAPDGSDPKPLTICFSSGNSGAAGLTRPKAAKNILVTGNSENYRPAVGKDQSDNIQEVYTGPRASSHGNCGDGRIRPHIVAPGEWTASANYDSRPGQKEYISSKNTWGGGSSAASPKTAGACALLIQWWRQHHRGQDPSPAMLRSLIVNGAEPITTGGTIPNKIQGWGRLNLENIIHPETQRICVDQTMMLKQRGDQQAWQIRVANAQKPLKITLAWTDPPGAIGSGTATAPAIVNKLALRVEVNGKRYRGNHFQNGWSYAEGTIDQEGWDNLQNIYLPAGEAQGTIRVTVTALEITTHCLTGQIPNPQQDFALVITNAQLDQAATPATVFVGADPAAKNNPKPDKPKDFWVDKPGSNDASTLKTNWWSKTEANAGKPKPSSSKPTPSDVYDWWLQDDGNGSKPEVDRQASLSDDKQLLQALNAGIHAVVNGSNYGIVMPSTIASASSETATDVVTTIISETVQDQGYLQTLNALKIPLSQTLQQLMTTWNQANSTQRRVAILLVGSGTRVSADDIAAMRHLSFQGQLYLVSDDGAILAFLAQRIHRYTGIHYRFAQTSQQLPALLQETLLEASGAQRLEVTKLDPLRLTFQVVATDQRLTLQLQFPPQEEAPSIQLVRPHQPAIDLNLAEPPANVQITQSAGILQLDFSADSNAWAGEWQILAQRDRLRVRAWVWGGFPLILRQQALPTPESDRGENSALLAMSSEAGMTFERLQSRPCVINQSGIASESDRPIDVAVEASRLDAPDSPRTTPTISTLVSIPTRPLGEALVVDLPLRIEGKDQQGNAFTRLLRHNLIQLEHRSSWRQQMIPEKVLSLEAQIAEVFYTHNEVSGLRLQKDDRTRTVNISAPQLRQQLTRIFRQPRRLEAYSRALRFQVQGQELLAIVHFL